MWDETSYISMYMRADFGITTKSNKIIPNILA